MAIRPLTGAGVPYTTAVFSDERQRPPLVRKTSPSRFVRSGAAGVSVVEFDRRGKAARATRALVDTVREAAGFPRE